MNHFKCDHCVNTAHASTEDVCEAGPPMCCDCDEVMSPVDSSKDDQGELAIVERSSGYWIVDNEPLEGPFIELEQAEEALARLVKQ